MYHAKKAQKCYHVHNFTNAKSNSLASKFIHQQQNKEKKTIFLRNCISSQKLYVTLYDSVLILI